MDEACSLSIRRAHLEALLAIDRELWDILEMHRTASTLPIQVQKSTRRMNAGGFD